MKVIPIYNAKNVDSLLEDGVHSPAGFQGFVKRILSAKIYKNNIQKGVLKRIRDEGTEGLSQRHIGIIKGIMELWEYECGRCGSELEWIEVDITDKSDLCDYCQNFVDKKKFSS